MLGLSQTRARSTRRSSVRACQSVLHDPAHPNLVNGEAATPQNVAKILQTGYTGSMGTMPNATANGLSQQDIANLVAFLELSKVMEDNEAWQ